MSTEDEARQMNRDGDRVIAMSRERLRMMVNHPYYAILAQELAAAWRAIVLQP